MHCTHTHPARTERQHAASPGQAKSAQQHWAGTHSGNGVLLDLVRIVEVPLAARRLWLVLGAVGRDLQLLLALDPVHFLLQNVGLARCRNHRAVQRQLALPLSLRGRLLRSDLGLQRLVVDTDCALLHIEDALVASLLGLAAAHHCLRLLDIRRHVVHDDCGRKQQETVMARAGQFGTPQSTHASEDRLVFPKTSTDALGGGALNTHARATIERRETGTEHAAGSGQRVRARARAVWPHSVARADTRRRSRHGRALGNMTYQARSLA